MKQLAAKRSYAQGRIYYDTLAQCQGHCVATKISFIVLRRSSKTCWICFSNNREALRFFKN